MRPAQSEDIFWKTTRVLIIAVVAIAFGLIFRVIAPAILQALFDFASWIRGADTYPYPQKNNPLYLNLTALLGLVPGAAFGSLFVRLMDRRLSRLKNTTTGDKVSLGLSLLIGIVCSFPVFVVLNTVSPRDAGIITPIVTIALAVLVMYIFKTIEEALPWYKLTGKPIKTGFKILDTSVIIDGRIYDVARIGFLEGRIYVPKFVLEELQHIADSSDALRRQRGRRGLDVLKLMQSQFELEVGSFDKFAPNEDEEVDSRLVRLAKALGAELVTNDVNLNRVATLQDVRVLNLNDLAMALKPNVLPRESLSLVVVREGSQYGQGVGYLDDGTMVVVENGRRFIGENVTVQVTQVIQTERGKMIFAEAPTEDESPTEPGNGRKRPYTRKNES